MLSAKGLQGSQLYLNSYRQTGIRHQAQVIICTVSVVSFFCKAGYLSRQISLSSMPFVATLSLFFALKSLVLWAS